MAPDGVVDEFRAVRGRETHAEFAARRGLKTTTFQKWLYAFDKDDRRDEAPAMRLLPVHVVGREATDGLISLELGDGLGLRFARGIDPAYIRALVTAMRPC